MEITSYDPQDYARFKEIFYSYYCTLKTSRSFSEQGELVIPPEGILPISSGLVAKRHNRIVGAGFIYFTNSALAAIEWVVVDPYERREVRQEATDLLLTALIDLAKSKEYKSILSNTGSFLFGRRLKKLGFKPFEPAINYLLSI